MMMMNDNVIGKAESVNDDGTVTLKYVKEQDWSSEPNENWYGINRSEYIEAKTNSTKEEDDKMQVYQAVAIKTDDDGDREHIIRSTMLLAESEQKARDKFVQELDEEYKAGSDDIELTTFL